MKFLGVATTFLGSTKDFLGMCNGIQLSLCCAGLCYGRARSIVLVAIPHLTKRVRFLLPEKGIRYVESLCGDENKKFVSFALGFGRK